MGVGMTDNQMDNHASNQAINHTARKAHYA